MKKILFTCGFILTALTLTSCSMNVSPNTYNANEISVANTVKSGVILSKRFIDIDATSTVGGVAGTAAGAAVGSTVGDNTTTHVVGAVGGAVAGGILGNAIDKKINRHYGYEYIIRLTDGSIISVAQTDDLDFKIGQHILVIYGARTRVVPDNTPPPVPLPSNGLSALIPQSPAPTTTTGGSTKTSSSGSNVTNAANSTPKTPS